MLLQKGTRVVIRVAVPAANGVLPRGSVAEVVVVPHDDQHAYRIRFLNGHEATVRQDEIAVLSDVKAGQLADIPTALAERRLREHMIYSCVVGSRAYGLEVEGQDTCSGPDLFHRGAVRVWTLLRSRSLRLGRLGASRAWPDAADARARFLSPDGVLIPSRDALRVAAVSCADHYAWCVSGVESTHFGFETAPLRKSLAHTLHGGVGTKVRVLSTAATWAEIDYRTVASPNVAGDVELEVTEGGLVHGLHLWFDA